MNVLNNEIMFQQNSKSVGIRWLVKAEFYISLYFVVYLEVFGRLEFSKSRFSMLGSLK